MSEVGYQKPPREHQWKPGESGNPKGRPKEKTVKEYAREYLANMTDKEKKEFLKSVNPAFLWRMAEGNPHQTKDLTSGGERVVIPIEVAKRFGIEDNTTEPSIYGGKSVSE